MIEIFIIKFIRTITVTLSTFLTLVLFGAGILLFLPADLYGEILAAIRLFFCKPVFFAVCGLSVAVIYVITYLIEERPFGFIDHFSYIPMHIFFGCVAAALVALYFMPEMPPLPRIKASIPFICLLSLSFPALFYSGMFGIIVTTDLATAKYRKLL